MKINQILNEKNVTLSFEVFPPKVWDKLETTKSTVKEIAGLKPDFMSVTYGAAGTTSGFTTEIANTIKSSGVTPLSHLTCLTSTKDKIDNVVAEMKENGIENILALRGDIPKDFVFPDKQYFHYAYELIEQIKTNGDFCLGGACYPEIHPESRNQAEDIAHLKEKVDCGLDFLTSQMFFENDVFFDFLEKARAAQINVPIIAGIMPITNTNQIERTCSLSGCSLPKKFLSVADRFGDNPAEMKQAGIIFACEQIIDLIANGVNNIHIYTMNKPDIAKSIKDNLSVIING